MTAAEDRALGLVAELHSLRASINDAQGAYDANRLARGTGDHVVEFCLIRAMGKFEEILGDLFYLALEGKHGPEAVPVLTVASRGDAVLIVSGFDLPGEGRYTAWMPYAEKTLKRASKLLVDGLPFQRLENRPTEKELLADLTTVRNAIAHDSAAAKHKFQELDRQLPEAPTA